MQFLSVLHLRQEICTIWTQQVDVLPSKNQEESAQHYSMYNATSLDGVEVVIYTHTCTHLWPCYFGKEERTKTARAKYTTSNNGHGTATRKPADTL